MITEVTGFYSRQTDRMGTLAYFFIIGLWLLSDDQSALFPLRNLLAALGLVFHPKSRKGTDGEGVSSFQH